MNSPATPAAPTARRTFQRATTASAQPAANPAATPIAATPASPSAAPPAEQPAQTEQPDGSDMLTSIDYGEAMNYNPDGLHAGTIKTVRPTNEGHGFQVFVEKEDGTSGSLLFMQYRKKKVGGVVQLQDNGQSIFLPDAGGRKAWGTFCQTFELDPAAVAADVVAYSKQQTNTPCALVGISAMWKWKTNGNFLNVEYDHEATLAMSAAT